MTKLIKKNIKILVLFPAYIIEKKFCYLKQTWYENKNQYEWTNRSHNEYYCRLAVAIEPSEWRDRNRVLQTYFAWRDKYAESSFSRQGGMF